MDDYLYLKTEVVRNTGNMDFIDEMIDLERSRKYTNAELTHKALVKSNAARQANSVKK